MRSHLIPAIRARFALPAWRSRDGSVAVVVALLLVVLVGFAALGTEIVALLMTSRQMQSAADSAALAAATARTKGYPTAYADEAVAIARDRKFVNGATNPTTTVTVSTPNSGTYAGNTSAVQVVITQVQPLLLTAVLRSTAYTLTVRSVGLRGPPCGLALDGSTASALLSSNGVTVLLDKCGVGANSSSATAIRVSGGSSIAAGWLSAVGNTSVTGGGALTIAGTTQTGATAIANPYAARVVPVPGTCLGGGSIGNNQTVALAPGTYCAGGINLGTNSHVTLNGVYILKDSSLTMTGNSSTLSGTATIVLTTSGTGTSIGSVTISNGTINLTAPTTGTTAGMVFFQDIRAPSGGTNTFTNAAATTLNGAVYFPNQTLDFSSGSSTASFCTLLIARKISFTGDTNLKANCTVFGTAGGALGHLVE